MVGIQEFYHLVHIGAVLGGLEGVSPEEFIVVHKVKGEGGQALSPFFQFLCADGRHQAGIHAPGEKGQMGTSETICLRTESSTRNDVFSMVLFIAVLMGMADQASSNSAGGFHRGNI